MQILIQVIYQKYNKFHHILYLSIIKYSINCILDLISLLMVQIRHIFIIKYMGLKIVQ